MKNWIKKNIKISKIFLYIIIGAGFLLILYPLYTNFIATRQESQILSAWEEQQEAFFEKKEAEAEEVQITAEEEAEEIIEETEESPAVSEEGAGLEEESEKVDLIEDPGMQIESSGSGISIYDGLTAEDFFPLKLSIPEIEVEWISYEGTDSATLKKGPGHESLTPLPGDIGRSTISGHRTTYGAPFNRVDELEAGDLIYLETISNELLVYKVTEQVIVKPTDVWILDGTDKKELLLTTCDPKFSAVNRLIIIAELVDIFSFEL